MNHCIHDEIPANCHSCTTMAAWDALMADLGGSAHAMEPDILTEQVTEPVAFMPDREISRAHFWRKVGAFTALAQVQPVRQDAEPGVQVVDEHGGLLDPRL